MRRSFALVIHRKLRMQADFYRKITGNADERLFTECDTVAHHFGTGHRLGHCPAAVRPSGVVRFQNLPAIPA